MLSKNYWKTITGDLIIEVTSNDKNNYGCNNGVTTKMSFDTLKFFKSENYIKEIDDYLKNNFDEVYYFEVKLNNNTIYSSYIKNYLSEMLEYKKSEETNE